MAVAYVRGMQGPDPDLPDVIASPKHFAVHSGPESTRHQANVYVSRHDLEDTYLPAFRAAIVEGRAGSIMCAYNRVERPASLRQRPAAEGAPARRLEVQRICRLGLRRGADIATTTSTRRIPPPPSRPRLRLGVDNECNTATLRDESGLGNRYKEAYERGLIGMEEIDRALIRLFSARYRPATCLRSSLPIRRRTPSSLTSPQHDALALKTAERSRPAQE